MRSASLSAGLPLATLWMMLACHPAAAATADQPPATSIAATPAPATTAVVIADAMNQARQWHVSPEQHSMSEVLDRWTREAGWTLKWEIPYSLSINATADIPGTLPEAVAKLLDGVHSTDDPIAAQFYQGNKVLRIFVE